MPPVRAPPAQRRRRAGPPALSARLGAHVALDADASGNLLACFDGYAVRLGTFNAGAVERAQELRTGLPLASLGSARRSTGEDIQRLVARLARHGLLEYSVGRSRNEDLVVIEPQVADYWPAAAPLRNADVLVLSRFAYMRRRGTDMVLESPRAGALFRICNPQIATIIATLSTPRRVGQLRRQDGFPGLELLALLVDCHILFKVEAAGGKGLRPAEGDADLVLWDFHDLLFHARSTEGRHANPIGGVFPYAGSRPPLPAVRPRRPGKKIDLRKASAHAGAISPFAKLLHARHSIRTFDDHRPITLAELARFLGTTARVVSRWKTRVELGDARPMVAYTARPYPSAGASYGLELYLAVDQCEGLARGFYHYDAGGHALTAIETRTHELDALLAGAAMAMDAPATPQILITIAARFGRVSWKYSGLAYALILKDVGVLTQTLYLMATDMGLGGCAIGTANIDLFARMTGTAFHVEGPVGQFALGRGTISSGSG
jgi:SagB-type dehydrogenase family enzyme